MAAATFGFASGAYDQAVVGKLSVLSERLNRSSPTSSVSAGQAVARTLSDSYHNRSDWYATTRDLMRTAWASIKSSMDSWSQRLKGASAPAPSGSNTDTDGYLFYAVVSMIVYRLAGGRFANVCPGNLYWPGMHHSICQVLTRLEALDIFRP